MHSLVGWAIRAFYARLRRAMGAGTKFPDGKDSHAPCPRCHNSQLRKNAWARRATGLVMDEGRATAFAHPTILHERALAKRNQSATIARPEMEQWRPCSSASMRRSR